jgi:small-conductance mechanosensitive channel
VIAINLIYTTLQEYPGSPDGPIVQIPNSLFFQRTTRRWRGGAGNELR